MYVRTVKSKFITLMMVTSLFIICIDQTKPYLFTGWLR